MIKNLFMPFLDKMDNSVSGSAELEKPQKENRRMTNVGTIHFIGIGGIGMSGIAEVLLNIGYDVSGSDQKKSNITERLESLGAKIFYEHKKENIEDCSVVVFSSAVPMTNPEIREAKLRKIPVIPRAEMLNELVRMKKGIGIAGTHGKTTTTGMISLILKEAGMDPTMLVGGVLDVMGSNAHLGHGEYLVFEACEAYNSIRYFLPEISVLLNIDRDHMECYSNFDELKHTFLDFLNKVPFYSFCVANIDDENIKSILSDITKKVTTFGFSDEADIKAYDVKHGGMQTTFKVKANDRELGEFILNIPGNHNVLNSLAAVSTALEIGVDIKSVKTALEKFVNSERRFQVLYNENGIIVIDDYAHHPKEISATLKAARQITNGDKDRRIIAVFQPHLFSRTKMHYEEFAQNLKLADKIILTEIYPAREKPIPGVTTRLIYDLLKDDNALDVEYIEKLDDLPKAILKDLKKGDILITLGAGNITKTAHDLSKLLN